MKKLCFLLSVTVLLLTSCQQLRYFQVYEVKSNDVSIDDTNLKYENEDCRITYNMWSPGGNASFLLFNKTENNLYVVMPKSFFIMNEVANDYYSESVYGSAVTSSASAASYGKVSVGGFLTNSQYWYPTTISRGYNVTEGVSVTKSVETKEQQFVCVPPKSAKFINGFNIYDKVYKVCGNAKHNYPKKTSDITNYNETNTPISFRNRIAYTFDENSTDIKYVEHKFWLSSTQNFSEKSAISQEKVEDCESGLKNKQSSFVISAPNKFYNVYLYNPQATYKEIKSK